MIPDVEITLHIKGLKYDYILNKSEEEEFTVTVKSLPDTPLTWYLKIYYSK
jgi:hypothetical protein